MSKDSKQIYEGKLQRIKDSIHLETPDRVPIAPVIESFPMFYSDITIKEAMYEPKKAETAYDKFFSDFDPDLAWDPVLMFPGDVLETLDVEWFNWPGHGVHENKTYQFVEGEYMKEDEYDELIYDPTNYLLTRYIPRSFNALKGFEKISNLRESIWFGWFNSFFMFSLDEVRDSLESLKKASDQLAEWFQFIEEYDQKLENRGYPLAYGGFSYAPFDLLGDTMRGTKGILTDIHRRPDTVKEACEVLTPIAIEMGANAAESANHPFVWIWLHKGVDEFMSDEQYRELYWPSLKNLIEGLVDRDLIPMVYSEGSYNTRLEVLRDIPKGKVLYHFEDVEMEKAQETLGDIACLSGMLPNSLLISGTEKKVRDHCKKLIDIVGEDGGLIMDAAALVDEAKPENLKAMFDVTKEYGVYD